MSLAPASFTRHPDLVSGSIGQLFLRYRRQTQPNRQIHPMRIFGVNQVNLPSAVPILQLLLARNRGLHRAKNFKMHQPVNGIFRSMSWRHAAAMLRKPLQQVRRDANVQRSIMLACNYVYAGRLFISHALESAAQWTLKQVQGDVNFGKMSCVDSNLRTASCRCGPLSAIPTGAFADPNFPQPHYSVWEGRKHPWVTIKGDGIEHYD